jgi:UDPglucose 6-dehydrogenase
MTKMRYSVGIMGTGFVGGALKRYFESSGITPFTYDKGKNEGSLEEVNKADVIFVCVPTPYYLDGSGFDLSYVRSALDAIQGEKIVVLKSTVIPGTTAMLQAEYPRHKLMYNPEFLTEVTADQDMNFPDRQIIGSTPQSYTVAADILAMLPLAPFERVVPSTVAEMVKYAGNTWFALKVAFSNQMYDLAQKMEVDYDNVKECMAADKRIGRTHLDIFHKGYRGYGGKCLPKDTRALIQLAAARGVDLSLLKSAEDYNNALVAAQGMDIQWHEGSPKKT